MTDIRNPQCFCASKMEITCSKEVGIEKIFIAELKNVFDIAKILDATQNYRTSEIRPN